MDSDDRYDGLPGVDNAIIIILSPEYVHCEGCGEGDGKHAYGFDREVPAAEERRAQAL